MERDHWMSPPLTLSLSPLGPRVRQGGGIARGHFNDPVFRASAHRRHDILHDAPHTRARPRPVIGGRNLYALVSCTRTVAPTLTDFFATKRWLFKDRARLAAILTNLTAAAIAIPLFLALQRLSSAAAMVLESGPVRAAYWLRTLSPWPEGLVTIAAMAVTKAAILSWRFGEPLARRTIGLLFLSTLAGMCVAAAIAVLLAYATTG
jgi:hypothetical protein